MPKSALIPPPTIPDAADTIPPTKGLTVLNAPPTVPPIPLIALPTPELSPPLITPLPIPPTTLPNAPIRLPASPIPPPFGVGISICFGSELVSWGSCIFVRLPILGVLFK